ncbi:MAG: MFS transporter, partial [Candidatus Poribacteria bacterium]|nr:MFS transporter [Candidatus Poribacteria bacterium]
MLKNDKKTIFGWCMYDWANSAYITTVVTAILPNYFARVVVGEAGVRIGNTLFSATTLWGYMVSLAAFFVFLCAPVLGAISDFSSAKKKFLMVFAYTGSLFAILLYTCQSGNVWQTMIFFLIAQIGFVGANVFYDAFLPQIASEDRMDWVSGKGFSFGYIGGGLQFAIALGLVAGHKLIGIPDQGMAARIGMAMAGLWWAGFTLFTFKHLKEAEVVEEIPQKYQSKPKVIAYIAIGLIRTFATMQKVGR